MGLRTWLGLKKKRLPAVKDLQLQQLEALPKSEHPIVRVPVGNYESYRQTQNAGNAMKIERVSAREPNIGAIAAYAIRKLGDSPRILCHGTRNGAELRFFKSALPKCTILGTDIADSAADFPDTIKWDFHDPKEEWIGSWDIVYSNSWDHAFEPERAFHNWMQCLSPKGMLFLEHTIWHMPQNTSELDPFGAEIAALIELLNAVGKDSWSVTDVISDLPFKKRHDQIVVVERKQ